VQAELADLLAERAGECERLRADMDRTAQQCARCVARWIFVLNSADFPTLSGRV
jgi:hypothetical protein